VLLRPATFLNQVDFVMGDTDKDSSSATLTMAAMNGTQVWHPISLIAANVELHTQGVLVVSPPTNQGSPAGVFAIFTVQQGHTLTGSFKKIEGWSSAFFSLEFLNSCVTLSYILESS
jgi:hypothetical protein